MEKLRLTNDLEMHFIQIPKCEKKEIAKRMKAKGISIAEIVEITGLTKEEIDKI